MYKLLSFSSHDDYEKLVKEIAEEFPEITEFPRLCNAILYSDRSTQQKMLAMYVFGVIITHRGVDGLKKYTGRDFTWSES